VSDTPSVHAQSRENWYTDPKRNRRDAKPIWSQQTDKPHQATHKQRSGSEILSNTIGRSASFFRDASKSFCSVKSCKTRQRRAASSVGPTLPEKLGAVLTDADKISAATLEYTHLSKALLTNDREPVPVGMAPVVYPDLVERYVQPGSDTSVFLGSLASIQSQTAHLEQLRTRGQTTLFLTDNIGRCLLNRTCDLQDQVDQYDSALRLIKARRDDMVFEVVEDFGRMAKALQYWTLVPEVPITLPDAPSLVDLRHEMSKFTDLYDDTLNKRGGQPSEAVVYYKFSAANQPQAFADLARNGVAYFSVPPPENPMYRDVRVSGHDVRAYLFPTSPDATKSITVQIKKGGYSTFFPAEPQSNPITFLHTDITENRIYSFIYDSETCDDLSAPCTSSECRQNEFLSVSPYGEWRIEVRGESLAAVKAANELKLAFKVRWHHSNGAVDSTQGDAMFGSDPCEDGATCFGSLTSSAVSLDECVGSGNLAAATGNDAEERSLSTGGKAAIAVVFIALILGIVAFVFREQLTECCPCCGGKTQTRRDRRGLPKEKGLSRSDLRKFNNPQYNAGEGDQAASNPRARMPAPTPAVAVNTDLPMYGTGKCTYISPTSGRACKNEATGLFCEKLHLCKIPDCGKAKASAETVCEECSAPARAYSDMYGEDMAVYETVNNGSLRRSISSEITAVRGQAGPIGRSHSTTSDV